MLTVNVDLANRLLNESWNHYRKTRQIYAETGYDKEYPLNFFWGTDNVRQLADIINRPVSALDKIALVHRTFMFSVNTDDQSVLQRMVDWYIDYLHSCDISLDDFDLSIQESPFSNPNNSISRWGRLLSPDFLRTVILCLEIDKHTRVGMHSRPRVLELGAGYGGLSRTFRLFSPNVSYTIIDIPETLFFSSLFLRLNFPEAKVRFVTDSSSASESLDEYDFTFIPTKFAEVLTGKNFEIFCNTASLGEMQNAVIRHWMNFVQNKINVRYFFGLNRFLNTIDPEEHHWRLDENICSVSFDRRWRILEWRLEPPFSRCPYLETIVTRNLEVIAERIPASAVNPDYDLFLSAQIASHVSSQDWYIHADKDNSMRLRDNMFSHDLTRKGTLFKLWESIRLYPRADNVTMMLKYLKILTKDKPFEEAFYYETLLEELRSAPTDHLTSTTTVDQGAYGRGDQRLPYEPEPILVSSIKGFNIVRFKRNFYAVSQCLGPIDLVIGDDRLLSKHQESGRYFIAESIEKVKALVDDCGYPGSPQLVEEGYHGYNIVKHRYTFYALSLALGHVDLTTLDDSTLCEYQERRKCFVAMSAEGVKQVLNWIERLEPGPWGLPPGTVSGFCFDGSEKDRIYLSKLMARLIQGSRRPVFFGTGCLCTYVFNMLPQIRSSISLILDDQRAQGFRDFAGIPIYPLDSMPSDVDAVFLCQTDEKAAAEMRGKLAADLKVIALEPIDVGMSVSGDGATQYRDFNLVGWRIEEENR